MNYASIVLLSLAAFAPSLAAQEPTEPAVNPAELLRQIQRNMEAVEKGLDELATEDAKAAGRRSVEDLNKLIDSLKSGGRQITTDIDTLIREMKSSSSGGGGGGGGEKSKSQSKDRNQSKERGGAKDRNKPEPSQQPGGGKPDNGKTEDNTAKDQPGGANGPGNTRPEDPREKFRQELLEGRWGVLPPELRQRLVERNFREFTPEYQEELRAYFRRLAR